MLPINYEEATSLQRQVNGCPTHTHSFVWQGRRDWNDKQRAPRSSVAPRWRRPHSWRCSAGATPSPVLLCRCKRLNLARAWNRTLRLVEQLLCSFAMRSVPIIPTSQHGDWNRCGFCARLRGARRSRCCRSLLSRRKFLRWLTSSWRPTGNLCKTPPSHHQQEQLIGWHNTPKRDAHFRVAEESFNGPLVAGQRMTALNLQRSKFYSVPTSARALNASK